MEIIDYIFSMKFLPHWHCFLGDKLTLWLNVIANSGIALAYFIIPIQLFRSVKMQKGEMPAGYRTIRLLFGSFILACGISHVFDIIIIWWPIYRFQVVELSLTAFVSLFTAFKLRGLIKPLKIKTYKLLDDTVEVTEIALPPKTLEPKK